MDRELDAAHDRSREPPRGRREKLLFLDFDGVLHGEARVRLRAGPYVALPAGGKLFEHTPILEELLAPYPDIRIVLSTSWVHVYRYSRAVRRLPASLRARVIGSTFHSAMDLNAFLSLSRGQQVWADVVRRQPSDWLALDDTYDGWPEHCIDNFIATDEVYGISEPKVRERIVQKLAALGK